MKMKSLIKKVHVQGHPTELKLSHHPDGGWELETTIGTHPSYVRVDFIDKVECIPPIVDASIAKVKDYLRQQETAQEFYTTVRGLGFE